MSANQIPHNDENILMSISVGALLMLFFVGFIVAHTVVTINDTKAIVLILALFPVIPFAYVGLAIGVTSVIAYMMRDVKGDIVVPRGFPISLLVLAFSLMVATILNPTILANSIILTATSIALPMLLFVATLLSSSTALLIAAEIIMNALALILIVANQQYVAPIMAGTMWIVSSLIIVKFIVIFEMSKINYTT